MLVTLDTPTGPVLLHGPRPSLWRRVVRWVLGQ